MRITLLQEHESDEWIAHRVVASGPAGHFAFVGIAPGAYRLELRKVGYHPLDAGAYQLSADLLDLQLVLERQLVEAFRFAIHSDMHIKQSGAIPSGLKQSIRGTIEHVRPSFVLFTGDLTSGSTSWPTASDDADYYWDSFFAAIAALLPADVCYFPVRGNHDYYTDAQQTAYHQRWGQHDVPGVAISGDPAGYYSFDIASCHFTVLAGHSTNLGTTQMDWLQQDLAAAQSAAHRFVFSHIPLAAKVKNGSGGIGYGTIHGTTSDDVPLAEVLEQGLITALIVGHEHVWVDDPAAAPGVRQVTCATASGTYNFPFIDGSQQQLVPSMVVVDVVGDDVSIWGARDAPEFCTTWEGEAIPPPPPRLLSGSVPPPNADILIVDAWQRGRLDERQALRDRASAMFDGFADAYGQPLEAAVVGQGAIAGGVISLAKFPALVWLLSNESSSDLCFSQLEQELLTEYVMAGGKLIVSGAEIGFQMVGDEGGAIFFQNVLQATYEGDDAGTGEVHGVAGTPFDALSVSFDDSIDPWRYPDIISPRAGAELLMQYADAGGDGAAVGWRGSGAVATFAFAIDSLQTPTERRALAEAALRFLELVPSP